MTLARSIAPAAVRGSAATNTTCLGFLKRAIFDPQNSMSSAGDGALVIAADVSLDGTFNPLNLGAGIEFVLIENLAVRAGITVPEFAFSDTYFSVGAGFAIAGLTIDAAYVLKDNPGETLVLSATFSFDELFAEPTTPEPGPTQ